MAVKCFEVLDYDLEFVLVGIIPDFLDVAPFFPDCQKMTSGEKRYLSFDRSNHLVDRT